LLFKSLNVAAESRDPQKAIYELAGGF
jgi:hypothetical protein